MALPGYVFSFLCLLSVSLRVTYFVYMYILRACTHSIPLARQGATREAFSSMRKCRNNATITSYNTGLCCCTTPPPPSFGHHRSGDFFTVNNGRRHRLFFFTESLPSCFRSPVCTSWNSLFFGLFVILSCRRIMFAVAFCSLYH